VVSASPAHVAFCQKITTPEDYWESQPATAGGILSLFDGRLDDREAVSQRLATALDGVPDGDLALAAFRRWRMDAPRELLGEFAWAVWDAGERQLMLARDTSASRALYVCHTQRFVAFATTLPALFALPDVPRDLDDQGVAEFIAHHPGQGERTVYRNVLRVMPGTTLTIGRNGLRRSSNWEPRPGAAPRDPMACAEAAREVFGRAVRARLRVVGPTAVSLSGGLDSSIVAAEAARQRRPDPVLGFSLVPPVGVPLVVDPAWAADDRPRIQALARAHPNLRVDYLEPPGDPIDIDPTALFVAAGHPVGLSPNIGWLLAAWRAAKASGARLMLTGDDGEMSLTHYGSLPAMVHQRDAWHALREGWRLSRGRPRGFLRQLDLAFLGGRLTRLRRLEHNTWPGDWRRYSPIHPDLALSAGVRDLLLAEKFPGGLLSRPPGYAEVLTMYLRRRASIVDNLAALRLLTGLDHACPFADRRVLAFCLSLPERVFIRNGQTRWLARTAFRDLLPPEVRDNRVKTEQNPEWFHHFTGRRGEMRAQLDRIASSPLANRALDIPRLRKLLDSWPASAEEARAAGPAYRSTLARGLHAGAFLRWADQGNGPSIDSREPS
jgi:asparagine synthase (glutamine-hydrolysing)